MKGVIVKTYIMIMAVLAVMTTIANSQPDTLWSNVYDHNGNEDGFNHVLNTSDDGFIAVGTTRTPQPFNFQEFVYLVKTNADGDTLWTKALGGRRNLGGRAVRETPTGYAIAGIGSVINPPFSDAFLIRTDRRGNLQWFQCYGRPYNDGVCDLVQTPDGGFLAVGYRDVYNLNSNNLYLIKVNADGDSLWTRTYGNGVGKEIIPTSDGNYVIVGENQTVAPYVIRLLKVNVSGDVLWEKTYSNGFSTGSSVQQTVEDGFIVLGQRGVTGGSVNKPWLIKTDTNGDTLWTRTYDFPGFHLSGGTNELRQTTDYGYVIVGYKSQAYVPQSMFLVRIDADGDTIWTAAYGGAIGATGHSVCETNGGNYLVAGKCNNNGYFVRLEEQFRSAAINKITIAPLTAYNILPNPFNPATAISYQLTALSQVNLSVYDTNGKLVATLVDGQQTAGNQVTTFNGSNLASGIYFAKLKAGQTSVVQKMVLVK